MERFGIQMSDEPEDAASWLALAGDIIRNRGDADRFIESEPGGVEDRIIDAIEHALALGVADPQQLRWAWSQRLYRLQRVAHASGRTRTRYLEAAENAVKLFPEDQWFVETLDDARELAGIS